MTSLMLRIQDLSIRQKLRLAILGTSSIAILTAGVAFAAVQWKSSEDFLKQDLHTLAEMLAANSTAAISFNDEHAARETLAALKARPNVELACLFSNSADGLTLFASYTPGGSAADCQVGRIGQPARLQQIQADADVIFGDDTLGHVMLIENDRALWDGFQANLTALGLILGACLILALVLSSMLQTLIAGPILSLAAMSSRISASGDFSLRANIPGNNEVGELVKAFNSMLNRIQTAEHQLRNLNIDLKSQVKERNISNLTLQKTLDQLRSAQDQLVQTEKMASLGGLVAGVAHEINTPVGIGVTAASTLSARVQELRECYANQTLTEGGLTSFLDLADQTSQIIYNNLERAANLIQSFKQVAVDQSSLDHRRFIVIDYINEVLMSLRPKLKHTHINIQLDCPDDLSIDSYPGLLSQILTNLVMNAVNHAYGPGDRGLITIACSPTQTGMRLNFSDDGRGIEPANLKHIFDPFFTTRRGEGGSGLGLHIVFNLVTQQLGGHISVDSNVGQGTHFQIDIQSIQNVSRTPIAKAS